LGTTATNQSCINEEIKSRLNSGNVYYHSFQSLLSSGPLRNILSVVLYGCGTWSLALNESQRLMAFENRVLRRIFGPKREIVVGDWRRLHNEDLRKCFASPNIIRAIK
jgi:hypothetical protein